MFTLADAVGLAKGAEGLGRVDPKTLQYNSAVKGDYVLSDAAAKYELERMAKGEHKLDGSGNADYNGNMEGKLPGHPTFSSESPYHIQGLKAAEGGEWLEGRDGKWTYAPSQYQFDRDPSYRAKLDRYYESEKGNGIDGIRMPGEGKKGLLASEGYISDEMLAAQDYKNFLTETANQRLDDQSLTMALAANGLGALAAYGTPVTHLTGRAVRGVMSRDPNRVLGIPNREALTNALKLKGPDRDKVLWQGTGNSVKIDQLNGLGE